MCIYQSNPSQPCYNIYIYIYIYTLAKVPALSCRSPPHPYPCLPYPTLSLSVFSRFYPTQHTENGRQRGTQEKKACRANHGVYELPIKTNGFFIEYWLFWAIVWHSRWSFREATRLSKFTRVKMEPLIARVASREPLEIYKNKLAHARDHSNHLAKFG